MTDPTAQPEDLTGAWQPEPPIGCMLPGPAPNTPPEPADAPRSAVQAADGPAEPRHAHDGAQAAQGGTGMLVVEPYRNDHNQARWVFRCWGTDTCDGLLSLDHTSRQWAEQARDRHVAEEHTEPAPAELTAEETRNLADDLGLQLYRAQDALAFAAECCDIAEREQRAITVADVREWLKGARCGRQLAADGTGFVLDPNTPPLHFVTWAGPPDSAPIPDRDMQQLAVAILRVQRLIDQHPVAVPTNLLEEALDQGAHDAGPSVAECAKADRVWPLEKAGE